MLNLANLNATQITYTKQSNQPNLPREFNIQKYIMKAGATPKLITSASESNSFPTKEVPFINLATLPSNASNIAAKSIAIIDSSNFESSANFIELKPIQTPINVKVFGKIILALLSDLVSDWGTTKTQCNAGKTKMPWQWDEVHQKAFDDNNEVIACDIIFAYPGFHKTFKIYTDTSSRQLDAVITQDNRPVALFSRKLSDTQKGIL